MGLFDKGDDAPYFNQDWANQATQSGYDWGLADTPQYIDPSSLYASYAQQGFQLGAAQRSQQDQMNQIMASMGGFHAPAMPHRPSGPSYEQQLANQRREIGEAERNVLATEYMDVAGIAADYINSEISGEISNARLLGIDYNITDEQKSTRISDYFASIWGEGQQSSLEALIGEWGKPTGWQGFSITRGDASKYASQPGEETPVAQSKGIRPIPAILSETEETLGVAQPALLGA